MRIIGLIIALSLAPAAAWAQCSSSNLSACPSPPFNAVTVATVLLTPKTVATLPACASGLKGALVEVTDATSPTYNGTLTGGGSVAIPVFCNGTAWTAH
jgi:hypothetical protein